MSLVADDVEFDDDEFDIEVEASRLAAAEYDRDALAKLLGVAPDSVTTAVSRGQIERPDHFDEGTNGLVTGMGVWTAVQVVRILRARQARQEEKESREAPCGTTAAYRRHRRRGEPVDVLCRLAKRRYDREVQARRANAGVS